MNTCSLPIKNFNSLNSSDCSFIYFGSKPMEQPVFHCKDCDPFNEEKICHHCYIDCHSSCKDNDLIPQNFQTAEEAFVCSCGEKHNHKLNTDKITACEMRGFDELILNPRHYTCNCDGGKIHLCFICSKQCHQTQKCEIKEQDAEHSYSCQCSNSTHKIPEQLVLRSIDYSIEQMSYYKSIWSVHLLNLFFSSKFPSFSNHITKVIHKKVPPDEKFSRILAIFSRIVSNINNYYFGGTILNEMFPFDEFSQIFRELKSGTDQNKINKFLLIRIFYYIHLKTDFQFVSSYTASDFLPNAIFERLEQRKRIRYHTLQMPNHHKKKSFFFECILTYINDNCCNEKDFPRFIEYYEIVLKIIIFFLKRLLLEKNELLIIIQQLYLFHRYVFDYLNDPGSFQKKLSTGIVLVFLLNEIYCMITLSYNDIIVGEYIELMKNSKSISTSGEFDFVHIADHDGIRKTLLKMIIHSGHVLSYYYKFHDADFGVDMKNSFEGMLLWSSITRNCFTVTDNHYYFQLRETKAVDIEQYIRKSQLYDMITMKGDSSFYGKKLEFQSFLHHYFTEIPNDRNDFRELSYLLDVYHTFINTKIIYFLPRDEDATQNIWNFKLLNYGKYKQLKRLTGKIDEFVDELIISNIDEIFTKILVVFSEGNKYHQRMGIGDWGLGIGDWGLGIGPNPQSPFPTFQLILITQI